MGAACFWHLPSCMWYRSLSRRQGEETSLPERKKGYVVGGLTFPPASRFASVLAEGARVKGVTLANEIRLLTELRE